MLFLAAALLTSAFDQFQWGAYEKLGDSLASPREQAPFLSTVARDGHPESRLRVHRQAQGVPADRREALRPAFQGHEKEKH